jgi:hypothetical protein
MAGAIQGEVSGIILFDIRLAYAVAAMAAELKCLINPISSLRSL